VSAEVPPEHTREVEAEAETVGLGFTMMSCEALAGQPALLIPLTLYILETDGVITKVDPGPVAPAQL
jgi:hypothetical protein